jgi:hypothetical protein
VEDPSETVGPPDGAAKNCTEVIVAPLLFT